MTQRFGLEGPSGVTSSKPHSKQGLFRRDPAAQGRGGWSKDADPTALGWRDLPASLVDLSTVKLCGIFFGLGSDLLSFVLPVFLNAPLLSTDANSGISAVHFPYFLICPII